VTSGVEARLREAVDALPEGLQRHILRVEEEAAALAVQHDVEPQRARIAALGHDLVRHKKGPELLVLASEYGLQPDEVEQATPILVHGPVAARMLERDYGLDDRQVIDGVDCHTTARAGMSCLEKVLFIADKVEPGKLVHEPALAEVKALAAEDLDAAVLRYLDYNLEQAIRRRWLVHARSVEARNELLRGV
jgi:predicted HD superfamily hydrolase involved in NAD metabolism